MADNTCKKRRGKKDRAIAENTTRKHKKRRTEKEAKRQSACKRIRADFPGAHDISRRVRKLKAA